MELLLSSIFPHRRSFFQKCLQSFVRIFRLHHLAQVQLLRFADGFHVRRIQSTINRPLGQLKDNSALGRELPYELVYMLFKSFYRKHLVD